MKLFWILLIIKFTVSNYIQRYTSPLLPTLEECGIQRGNYDYEAVNTTIDEFPWMALLEYDLPKGHRFLCGGVLINKRYVITAAHCVSNDVKPLRLGEYDTSNIYDCHGDNETETWECAAPVLNLPVEEIIVHKEYALNVDLNRYHDIALIRMIFDATYSRFIKPICLADSIDKLVHNYVGAPMYIAGWGRTDDAIYSPVKLKLAVPVKSREVCGNAYKQFQFTIGLGQICAGGEKGRDACGGDSGGPLMGLIGYDENRLNWYAIGIISYGPSPCGQPGKPSIYTRVPSYMPWIISHLRP